MKLSSIGEFGLIEKFKKGILFAQRSVIVGIGDDAAVLKISKESKYQLFTTDMLIEGVHFDLSYTSPFQLGWKALSINISDIAAMGGIPTFALVSLGLKKDAPVKFVEDIYQGIKRVAKRFSVDIVGGDTVSSSRLTINISLLGEVERKNLILRRGAKPGDSIFVTGTLGDSAVGLAFLKRANHPLSITQKTIRAHLTPLPRLKEARALAQTQKVSSMIDVSDGLSSDLIRIAEASKVGVKIYADKIPLSFASKKGSKLLKKEPLDFALYGGEDYELLFTVPKSQAGKLSSQFTKKVKTHLLLIGEIIPPEEGYQLLNYKGRTIRLKAGGYNHFSRGSVTDNTLYEEKLK